MTHQEIKKAASRRPFRPFGLRLPDGELVQVRRENEIGIHPRTKKTVVIFESGGTYRILDVALITELHHA
jgi:hypothetical protein